MYEMRLPAVRENLERVNAFAEEILEEYECSPRVTMQLMVALEELFVNVADYAYACPPGEVLVTLDYNEEEDMVLLTLRDHGLPFDPVNRPDPDVTLPAEERKIGGLGIFMVKKSMDRFTYERVNGENVVTIGRKLHR